VPPLAMLANAPASVFDEVRIVKLVPLVTVAMKL